MQGPWPVEKKEKAKAKTKHQKKTIRLRGEGARSEGQSD
jgi:hypothetical protein